jgi:long-chain acyl-CoA synthetase
MHPYRHAAATPDKAAIIVAETGAVTTYAELDAASNRTAQYFRAHGLVAGDAVAFFLENTIISRSPGARSAAAFGLSASHRS